jgi:ABC-type nitrate/sulfonate/bicarbonate transport system substrate-binding protein
MARRIVYGAVTEGTAILARFGLEKGIFAAAGIELAVETVFGGPEMAEAVESGRVQIGELGSPPGITAIGRGRRIRVVGSSLDRGLAFFLITRPELADWEDFRGVTVGALSKGSCGDWYLRALLAQHGLDPDRDVTFRHLGADYGRQVELLQAGAIAAILANEPYATLAESVGAARSWGGVLELGRVPAIQWSIQVAGTDFLAREPGLACDVLRLVRETGQYASRHEAEWLAFYRRLFGITDAVARRALAREWPYLHYDGQLDLPGLDRAIDLQHGLGAIPRRLQLEEVVDFRFQPAPTEPALAS